MQPSIQTAAMMVIGNEILTGRTTDKNIAAFAQRLFAFGIDLLEVRVIADSEAAIGDTAKALSQRYDYVFSTGGIGPTHDDITAASIAHAFGLEYATHPEADAILRQYYAARQLQYNTGRQRMAKLPMPCQLIDNAVSGAPGFQIDNIFVLPGVPRIAAQMMDDLLDSGRVASGQRWHIHSITIKAPESEVVHLLADCEKQTSGLQVGSYPQEIAPQQYQVNVVLRHRKPEQLAAAAQMLKDAVCDAGFTLIVAESQR